MCFPRHPDLQATTDGNSFNISGMEPNAKVRRNLGSSSDMMKTVNVSNFANLSHFASLGGYEINVDGHITFHSTINITGSTWIFSSTSAILDGNGKTRLFDIVNNVVASNVTFTGLVLTNGFVQASVSIFVLWIYSLISVLVLEMVAG